MTTALMRWLPATTLSALTLAGVHEVRAADDAGRLPYNPTRWKESYAFLSDESKRSDFFDPVKYIPFGMDGETYLTLGGQWREEALRFDAPNFGFLNTRGDDYFLHRVLLFADGHVTKRLRVFVELGNELAPGKRRPVDETDKDRLDLQLAFIDYAAPVGSNVVTTRVGRQEITFDPTNRFLAERDGPNVRQAFDGGRIDWDSAMFTVTAFGAQPVNYKDHALFDDSRNQDARFDGIYLQGKTLGPVPGALAAYVYRYTRKGAAYSSVTGNERRIAYALRFAGKYGPFDWDLEPMQQTGHVGGQRIRAWGFGSIVGLTFFAVPWSPRLSVQADIASGDHDSQDGTLGTFNPLFPKGGYFMEAGLTGFANLRHLKTTLAVVPTTTTGLSASYATVSKQSRNDFAYSQPLVPIPNSLSISGRHVGSYVQLLGTYQVDRHLSVEVELDRYNVSRAIESVGGKDVNYAKFLVNFLF